MSMSKEEVLESIAQMSVMDVVDLVKAMEEKFGVSAAAVAAAPVAAAAGGDAGKAEDAEASTFDVVLTEVGDKKVNVIKTVRTITGLGLREAKGLVDAVVAGESTPVKEGVDKDEAEKLQKQLEEAGAKSELK